jgi:hypothetical protein
MTKKQKERLSRAEKLLDQAEEIICTVKNERRGVAHDDDYYYLEDVQFNVSELSKQLNEFINPTKQ